MTPTLEQRLDALDVLLSNVQLYARWISDPATPRPTVYLSEHYTDTASRIRTIAEWGKLEVLCIRADVAHQPQPS